MPLQTLAENVNHDEQKTTGGKMKKKKKNVAPHNDLIPTLPTSENPDMSEPSDNPLISTQNENNPCLSNNSTRPAIKEISRSRRKKKKRKRKKRHGRTQGQDLIQTRYAESYL